MIEILNKIFITLFGVSLLGVGAVSQPPVQDTNTYFAEIDSNNKVIRVIVADKEFIDSGVVGDPKNWVQTYTDGSQKKNYAGKGYKYDKELDAFIPKKPTEDSTLNLETATWITPPPVPIIKPVNNTATTT